MLRRDCYRLLQDVAPLTINRSIVDANEEEAERYSGVYISTNPTDYFYVVFLSKTDLV